MPARRPQSTEPHPHRPTRPAVTAGLAVTLLLAIGSAACGSSSHNGLSSADAARLRADIAAARAAAARHEAPQAASSLVAFRRQVGRLAAEHKLTTAQAQALQAGAQQAQARVALDVKPAPAPATTSTAAPTPPAPPAGPGPPGKAKGHDKHGPGDHGGGKGHGGD